MTNLNMAARFNAFGNQTNRNFGAFTAAQRRAGDSVPAAVPVQTPRMRSLWMVLTVAATFASVSPCATLRVKAGAAPGGNGANWQRAYDDLQPALAAARAGDSIWMAAGTYFPTRDANREASFRLKPGVAVYGGFSGGENSLAERDWTRNRTVLSGDIGTRGAVDDNVYHVVWGADDAVLDGFVITGGNGARAGGPPGPGGPPGFLPGPGGPPRPPGPGATGPIHISPQQILSGAAAGQGGGMINLQTAPTVRNCTFEHNRAMKGGAVYNMVATSFPPRPGEKRKAPLFIGCTFRNNFAMGRGGGVSNDLGTAPVFLNCVFEENETPQKGGGMYNDFGCSPILINCLFRLNKAETAAAMGNDGQSSPILLRCTFTANQAQSAGPSLYQGTGPANNPVVLESVVWGNRCDWESAGFYNWHDNTPVVKDSVIEGGYPGAQGDDPRLNGNGVAAVNAGYRPGDARFAEGMLAALLDRLRPYQSSGLDDRPPEPGRRVQVPVPSSERIVYVDASRPAGGDGRSWAAAYSSLEAALVDAGRDGAEVRVAAGVYRPAGNDRSASFRLYPGVRVYGGFTGVESSRDARDWRKNRTTLSGDMGVAGRPEDNVYHVVTGADGALLDGFIITSGYADGVGYDGKGGGLINYRRAPQRRPNLPDITGYSPEIRNCVFTGNFARDGGAVYNYDRAKPRFIACVFTKNRADNGGAVLDRVGVEALYEQCEFLGNWARWRGGAAYFDYGSRPKINGSAFVENSTDGHGGAIYSASRASQLENTAVNLTGCRLEKNAARGDGGAAAFDDSTAASVAGSQFTANVSSRNGGAVAVTNRSVFENRNSRFQDNSARGEGGDVFQERNPGR